MTGVQTCALPICVGAAIGATGDYLERAAELVKAHVDVIVIDIAHGHSVVMGRAIDTFRKHFPDVELVAGNVATGDGVRFLADEAGNGYRVPLAHYTWGSNGALLNRAMVLGIAGGLVELGPRLGLGVERPGAERLRPFERRVGEVRPVALQIGLSLWCPRRLVGAGRHTRRRSRLCHGRHDCDGEYARAHLGSDEGVMSDATQPHAVFSLSGSQRPRAGAFWYFP